MGYKQTLALLETEEIEYHLDSRDRYEVFTPDQFRGWDFETSESAEAFCAEMFPERVIERFKHKLFGTRNNSGRVPGETPRDWRVYIGHYVW